MLLKGAVTSCGHPFYITGYQRISVPVEKRQIYPEMQVNEMHSL